MPIFLRALLWAMFHPLSGMYHLAYWYHFPMGAAERISILSKVTDVVIIVVLLTIAERIMKKRATKIGDGTTGGPYTLPQRLDDEEDSGTYGGPYQRHPKYPPGRDSKD